MPHKINRHTLVIAEPGCTAEGVFERFVDLITVTAQAGADVFKPQWCSDPEELLSKRHIVPSDPKYALYRQAYGWLAFPSAWHAQFRDLCIAQGLQYACSVYLTQDVQIAAEHADYLKISSFENYDRPLLNAALLATAPEVDHDGIGSIECPVIVSAGQVDDISEIVGYRARRGRRRLRPMALLHCTSAYPTPMNEMHVSVIGGMSPYTGLSDHSGNVVTGAVAVGAGATVIETHIRLPSCRRSNPDYMAALDPVEFLEYVSHIRRAETLMGSPVKRVQPSEMWALQYRSRGGS